MPVAVMQCDGAVGITSSGSRSSLDSVTSVTTGNHLPCVRRHQTMTRRRGQVPRQTADTVAADGPELHAHAVGRQKP